MLQSEAIKSLCHAVRFILGDLNQLKAENPKLAKAIADNSEILQEMNEIFDAELEPTAPKAKRQSNGDKYHYEGIEEVTIEQSKRPSVIELSVYKGETLIISFNVDRSFKWIMRQNKDQDWYACGRISLNTKTKWTLATCLKKLADKEVEQPGAFAEKYLPPVTVVE